MPRCLRGYAGAACGPNLSAEVAFAGSVVWLIEDFRPPTLAGLCCKLASLLIAVGLGPEDAAFACRDSRASTAAARASTGNVVSNGPSL